MLDGDKKYFTVKEVAGRLRITEDQVRSEIRRRRLGANKIGGEYRISEEDVVAFERLTHTGGKVEDEDDLIEIGA